MNGTNVDEQSLTDELTEEQMFSQVSEALKSGTDVSDIMSKDLSDSSDSVVPPSPSTSTESTGLEEVPNSEQPTTVVASTPANQAAAEAWLEGLPVEVQDKFKTLQQERDRLQHKVRSDEGRVPNLQRKVEEMERKLRQRPEDQAASVTSPAAAGGKLSERLAQIREVDPILAETLESLRDEVSQPLRQEIQAKTEHIQDEMYKQEIKKLHDAQWDKLITAVPQAPEVFKLPAYRTWVDEQSEGVQNLAASIYADDILVVFDAFAKEMQRRNPAIAASAPATTTPPVSTTTTINTAKIEEERQRKLRGSAPSTVSGVSHGSDKVPTDPEELFDYYTSKIKKNEM